MKKTIHTILFLFLLTVLFIPKKLSSRWKSRNTHNEWLLFLLKIDELIKLIVK